MQTKMYEGISPDRVALVQRVYLLLTGCIGVASIASVGGLTLPASSVLPLFLLALVLLFATFTLRHQEPFNLLALFSFAAVEGLSIGPFINQFISTGQGYIVTEALGLTSATFVALSAYTLYKKQDFDYLGGFLFSSLIGLVVVGLFGAFFGLSQTMHLIYCYFGVLVFIGYILYDTSQMLLKYDTDEYIVVTINLFLDILNLFVRILSILGKRD